MTGESALRERVLAQARSWLGRREEDGSFREIVDRYNAIRPLPAGYVLTYSDPWCAAFVSAVGAACGLSETLLPECSCGRMLALYQAAGLWEEADDFCPRAGDLIFYGWSDGGRGDYAGPPDHVGLVESCEDGLITAIEGNYRNAVARRTLPVDGRYIRGFARPAYAAAAGEAAEPDRYQTLDSLPAWARPTVKRLCRAGVILGSGGGADGEGFPVDLDLSRDMLRLLVWNDRAGAYGR